MAVAAVEQLVEMEEAPIWVLVAVVNSYSRWVSPDLEGVRTVP